MYTLYTFVTSLGLIGGQVALWSGVISSYLVRPIAIEQKIEKMENGLQTNRSPEDFLNQHLPNEDSED